MQSRITFELAEIVSFCIAVLDINLISNSATGEYVVKFQVRQHVRHFDYSTFIKIKIILNLNFKVGGLILRLLLFQNVE